MEAISSVEMNRMRLEKPFGLKKNTERTSAGETEHFEKETQLQVCISRGPSEDCKDLKIVMYCKLLCAIYCLLQYQHIMRLSLS